MTRDNTPNVAALISQPEDICLPVMTFLPSRFRPKLSPCSPSMSPCWSIFPPLRSLGFVLSLSISNTFSSSLHVVFYLNQEKFCSWQEVVLSLKCAGSRLVSGWRNNSLDLLRSLLSTCVFFSVLIQGGECQWSRGKAPDVSFLSESAWGRVFPLPPLPQKAMILNQVPFSLTTISAPYPFFLMVPSINSAWKRWHLHHVLSTSKKKANQNLPTKHFLWAPVPFTKFTDTGPSLSGIQGDLFNCFVIIICMQKALEQKPLFA